MANSESCLSFTKKAKRKRDLNFFFAYGELTKLLFFFRLWRRKGAQHLFSPAAKNAASEKSRVALRATSLAAAVAAISIQMLCPRNIATAN